MASGETRRVPSRVSTNSRPPQPASHRLVAERRISARLAVDVLAKRAKQLVVEYDTSGAGKLNRDEVTQLLTDLTLEQHGAAEAARGRGARGTYAPGSACPSLGTPSSEEVDFLFSCADHGGSWTGGSDGFLDASELEQALQTWRTYHDNHQEFEAALTRFDADCSGQLERGELKNFLEHLNGSHSVSASEVAWVLKMADRDKNGFIDKMELMKATSEWYSYVETGKSSICTVL